MENGPFQDGSTFVYLLSQQLKKVLLYKIPRDYFPKHMKLSFILFPCMCLCPLEILIQGEKSVTRAALKWKYLRNTMEYSRFLKKVNNFFATLAKKSIGSIIL